MFKELVPQPIKTFLKDFLWTGLKDTWDSISGRRSKNIPPTRLMFDGPIGVEEYITNGIEFLDLFLTLVKPKKSAKILDIGSGIGRKTLPLTKFLNQKGSYDGLEIVKRGVAWCNKHITKNYPNFKFTHVDIYNGFYNPKGKIKPERFSFPFPDNYFDVVIATSVFTHMLPSEVKNYHKEIGRVLKRKGQGYLTYFLVNSESLKNLKNKKSTLPFKKTNYGFWTTVKKIPEIAIAFDEVEIKKIYSGTDLKMQTVKYGGWSGRKTSICYQDIIISLKN